MKKAISPQFSKDQDFSFLAGLFTSFLCILFGANAVAIKMSLSGFGPFTTAGLRFSLASTCIFLWALGTHQRLRIKKGQALQLLILGLTFVLQMSLLYLGLDKTFASRGTLLINLQPFFVLFLAHFFIPGDTLTARKIVGLLLSFAGVALVFSEREGVTSSLRLGDLMILITSFVWALRTVYIKRIINAFSPFQIVFYPMLISVPFFFLQGIFLDPARMAPLAGPILGALLYQGELSSLRSQLE